MMSKNKFCYLCFLGILIVTLLANKVNASCTQEFYFASGKLNASLVANYGGEDRDTRFINDIKKILPHMIGLSQVIDQDGEAIEIFIGCQQYNKSVLKINNNESKTIKCDESTFTQTFLKLADELGKNVIPKLEFTGYTLQIAYIEEGKDALQEKKRWRNKLDDIAYNGTIYIESDCTQTPIWIYRYPDNSSVIRFGIFGHYKNANEAISILKLAEKNAQIVPLHFKIKDINYFFE